MTSATNLAKKRRVRAMAVGYPGSGKTGALAALVNAGFNVRVLDFDGNFDPLLEFATPEGLERLEIVTLEDKLRFAGTAVEPSGMPDAYARAMKLLDNWKYSTAEGEEVDLGPVRDWGQRDVLVVDSLSGMGRAAFRRILKINNRNSTNTRDKDWGSAMADQEAFVERITSNDFACHIYMTAHLKIIGPKPPRLDKDDNLADVKVKYAEALADLVPTRLFPSALGQTLPQNIAEHFPTVLRFESKNVNGKAKRVIRTQPTPEFDVKVPTASLPPELPVDDGLLTIFKALTGEKDLRQQAA